MRKRKQLNIRRKTVYCICGIKTQLAYAPQIVQELSFENPTFDTSETSVRSIKDKVFSRSDIFDIAHVHNA